MAKKSLTAVIGVSDGDDIATKLAFSGKKVVLVDEDRTNLSKAYIKIKKELESLVAKKKISEEKKISVLSSIYPTTKIEHAKYSSMVIDTQGPRKTASDLKKLNTLCEKDTVFAVTSSNFKKLEESIDEPSRFLGLSLTNKKIIDASETSTKAKKATKKILDLI